MGLSAATIGGDFPSTTAKVSNAPSTILNLNAHDASNQSFCNKLSNNKIYNTNQSKGNSSILNSIVGNDIGQQHGAMKNNSVIMSMSHANKFQLTQIIFH